MQKRILIAGAVFLMLFQCSGCKKTEQPPPPPQETGAIEEIAESVKEAVELEFTLMDEKGQKVSLGDYDGKVVVLEWTNYDCPFVKRHYEAGTMKTLAGEYADQEVVWLAVNSTNYADTEGNMAFVEKYELPYRVLDDHEGIVGRMFGATNTPHMFILDKQGAVAYHGAIDNDPGGTKTADGVVNYVSKALDELLAGDAVTTSKTEAYGCTVKY